VATSGEAGIAEVEGEVEAVVEVDDCVELEPHAATDAATTAVTAMNRREVHLCVLVFKIRLPDPGWRLALTAGPDEGVADGMGSPAFGSPISGLPHVQGEAIPAENRCSFFRYTTVHTGRPASKGYLALPGRVRIRGFPLDVESFVARPAGTAA